jgi:hypothetical protein
VKTSNLTKKYVFNITKIKILVTVNMTNIVF